MIENQRFETNLISDPGKSSDLDETESIQSSEIEQFQELVNNPELILGFPIQALFNIDILTKNYPSIFYSSSNVRNKRYQLTELIDPRNPGHPFPGVTGYSFAETQRLKRKYPDSLEIAQAEVGLAIQAYCFLATILMRKVGWEVSIEPTPRDQGVLTLKQLFEKLSVFQDRVVHVTRTLELRTTLISKWLPMADVESEHSIVKLALLVRLQEQTDQQDNTSWSSIEGYLEQITQYEPIYSDDNFKTVLFGALLNVSNAGLYSVSFRIREYLCVTILGLSGVFQYEKIIELFKVREVQKRTQLRKDQARLRANKRLEQLRGKGSLEGRSLLPQPPKGVDSVEWLSQQDWYYRRIIQGAAKQADQSELTRAYPNSHYLYEAEYYQKTLEKARGLDEKKPGIIVFLLRFGVTQVLRFEEEDLLSMYENFQDGKSDLPRSDYYLYCCDTHDHNNAHLVNGKVLPAEYRKQGKVQPLICEFDSPFELYKILTFVASVTNKNPKSVLIRAHGGVGTISYPTAITTAMIDLISSRIQRLVTEDEKTVVIVESCHAADRPLRGNSFAEHISKLGMGVFAPEGLSYGLKSAEIDSDGYVTDVLFKAFGTRYLQPKQHSN